MRIHALIRKPSAHREGYAQSAKAMRLLRCQSREAVQSRVFEWLPVKVTKDLRCYIFGLRCHHGLTGVGIVVVGTVLRKPELVLIGVVLCLHDKEDWPWPMKTQ